MSINDWCIRETDVVAAAWRWGIAQASASGGSAAAVTPPRSSDAAVRNGPSPSPARVAFRRAVIDIGAASHVSMSGAGVSDELPGGRVDADDPTHSVGVTSGGPPISPAPSEPITRPSSPPFSQQAARAQSLRTAVRPLLGGVRWALVAPDGVAAVGTAGILTQPESAALLARSRSSGPGGSPGTGTPAMVRSRSLGGASSPAPLPPSTSPHSARADVDREDERGAGGRARSASGSGRLLTGIGRTASTMFHRVASFLHRPRGSGVSDAGAGGASRLSGPSNEAASRGFDDSHVGVVQTGAGGWTPSPSQLPSRSRARSRGSGSVSVSAAVEGLVHDGTDAWLAESGLDDLLDEMGIADGTARTGPNPPAGGATAHVGLALLVPSAEGGGEDPTPLAPAASAGGGAEAHAPAKAWSSPARRSAGAAASPPWSAGSGAGASLRAGSGGFALPPSAVGVAAPGATSTATAHAIRNRGMRLRWDGRPRGTLRRLTTDLGWHYNFR